MLSERDLLLINAQYIPASQLIIQAKSKLSDMLDGLMQYLLTDKGEGGGFFADQLLPSVLHNFRALRKTGLGTGGIRFYETHHAV